MNSWQEISAKKEGYTVDTKRQNILDYINKRDFELVKQNVQDCITKNFADSVKRIRQREQMLLGESEGSSQKAQQQTAKKCEISQKHHYAGKILSIPNWIIHQIVPLGVREDLWKWQGSDNSERRIKTV